MLTRALHAGVKSRWVAGDEVYGADRAPRAECELARIGYVLAIGRDRRIPTAAGLIRADTLAVELPRHAWQRLSPGRGAKGERFYQWARIERTDRAHREDPLDHQCWSLLILRNKRTGELAFYRCDSPDPVPLRELVRVAGRRCTIEESFQAGKSLTGLDEHQLRRGTSWQRWTLLSMLAHALLAVIAADEHDQCHHGAGLITLTCNKIRRLIVCLVIDPARGLTCPHKWSDWRRRHQRHARSSDTTAAKEPTVHGHNDLRLEY